LHSVANRCDNHSANLVWLDSSLLDGLIRGANGKINGLLGITRATALDDAGALTNPLIRGVDRSGDVVVADDRVAAGST
jgi:hypothetical protein